ncbi:MAG: CapA family protein [Oscillospiraceae bacterium]|nr:CapA family protein [Oscillospiraceae bacterium]
MKKKLISLLLALAVFSILATGCFPIQDTDSASSVSSSTPVSSLPEQKKEPITIRMVAAGDNLIHSSLYKQAKARAGGEGYDFNFAYEHVKKLINGDINVLNQETLLAAPPLTPSDYPLFCTPTEVGDLMLEMGFNVFTLANNHMLDKGEKGFLASLDYWDKQEGIIHSGAYRNQAELEEVRLISKKGITAGFVSITEQTNGLVLPKNSELKYISSSDEATIEKQIKATEQVSDFTVVAIHWGTENSLQVIESQKTLAEKMVGWGADLIIGTHPHVLQPMEYLEKPDGGKALVAYSIGNFISAMNVARCMLGGVLDLELTKDPETEKTEITSAQLIPVVNHYDSRYQNVRAYPLEEYTEALAASHGIKPYDSRFSYTYIKDTFVKQIDQQFAPEAFQGWYQTERSDLS